MKRKTLALTISSSELDHYAGKIRSGRYFRKISSYHIKEMLLHSELITLNADEYLFRKDQSNSQELIVLLEGSLLVTSDGGFIMRLNNPGDLVGELSIITGESIHFADVVSEEKSKVFNHKDLRPFAQMP